jgi:hypothetical protein
MDSSCATCRHHRSELHPKVLDTAFDTVVAFDDRDERVYFCTSTLGPHAGQKVGSLPVFCEAWSAPRAASDAELDRLLALAEERAKAAKEEDDR